MAGNALVLPVRIAQAVLAIIVLGLIANTVSWINGHTLGHSWDSANFLLFCSVWTFFIAVPFLVAMPMFAPQFAPIYAMIALDAVTMIFWFAGFIAVAAQIYSPSECTHFNYCRTAQGAAALGAFEWLLFTGASAMDIREVIVSHHSPKSAAPPDLQPAV
ncbi:hypothetical protein Egran_05814 [Elaphomyces granulatus]|uniref:MARVEL domain-containing protein n=1 Tax=Elaphomyces granulatus TaxID=519963 RepID=A0A232LQY3_9EURO|nr:hypothetical protein Egran_05814 [Elaphomyces granulatus]